MKKKDQNQNKRTAHGFYLLVCNFRLRFSHKMFWFIIPFYTFHVHDIQTILCLGSPLQDSWLRRKNCYPSLRYKQNPWKSFLHQQIITLASKNLLTWKSEYNILRSSRLEMFCKKCVPKRLVKFIKDNLGWSHFLPKLQFLGRQFYQKNTPVWVYSH